MAGIEDFLASSEGQDTISPSTPQKNESSGISKWLSGEDEANKLDFSVKTGMGMDADQSERVLKLQMKTGLPEELIQRNVDSIEAETKKQGFDAGKFRNESPIVSGWYAENPNHAAVAYEDIQKMGYLERQFNFIKDQYAAGNATTELGDIGQAAFLGNITPDQRKRQAELEKTITPKDYGIGTQGGVGGFFEGVPAAIANQVPIQFNTLTETAKYTAAAAGVGAGIGAGAGAIAGPAGAAAGAVAGAGQGALLGWRVGSGIAAGRLEAGLAYLDYEKMKDENGNTLDRTTAMGAAVITGVINGGLESMSFGTLTKNVPGLRNLSRPGIKALLANPTTRAAITNYAKHIGEAMASEGGTEFLQELVKSTAGELAIMQQDGSLGKSSTGGILNRLFSPDKVSAAVQSGIAGAQGGGGMSAVLGTTAVAKDIQRAKNAEANAQAFAEIGKKVKDTKLFSKLPGKTQEIVERLVKDGPAEKVYAPVEAWNEYWQSKGVDPREVAQSVVGDTKAYDEAVTTGSDIAIPTSRYAVTIAPSDHNEFFQNELKSNPSEMNAREAREFTKKLDELDAKQQKENVVPNAQSREQVRTNVSAQLIQAGIDEATAGNYAQIYEEAFGSLGERAGIDPLELFNRYGLQIGRPELQGNVGSNEQFLEQAGMAASSGRFLQAQSQDANTEVKVNGPAGSITTPGVNANNQQIAPVYDQDKFGEQTQVLDNVNQAAVKQSTIDTGNQQSTIVEAIQDAVPENDELEILRAKVQALETELRTSAVTGLRNLRAFEEDATLGWPEVAAMDMDGLKKLNDAIGHEAADKVLNALGGVLLKAQGDGESVRFYHRSGDEFAARFKTPEQAAQFMAELQNRLDSIDVELTVNDKTYVYNGIGLSYGTGTNYEEADARAIEQKQARLASGQREDARGQGAPRRLSEVSGDQTGGQRTGEASQSQERVLEQSLSSALIQNKQRLESEGFTFSISEDSYFDDDGNEIEGPALGEPGSTFRVYATDTNDNDVGYASFLIDQDGSLIPNDENGDTEAVKVEKDFQRKGIATELYRLAAETTGKSISNKNSKTKAGEALRAALRSEEPTVFLQSQGGGDGPLGRIRFGNDRQFRIDLLKNANLSTFIHESGHFYLEVMNDLASMANANELIKKDFETIKNWLGVKGGEAFTTEQHEQFARGFEAYVMEGKAPSTALRSAFSKFRAWLSSIYRKVKNLNVELTPEVRQVMDRLLATDEQIEAAQDEQNMQPLFENPQEYGMSPDEAVKYSDAVTEARIASQEALNKKVQEQFLREQKAKWKEERDQIKEEISDEVNQERGYIALEVLQRGKLPDGRDAKELIPGFESIKINSQAIVDAYGEEQLKKLPKRPSIVTKTGGVNPEQAAGLFGYNSAQEMFNEITTQEERTAKIERLTDAKMKSIHGDILTDGTMPVEAMKAIHNEKRSYVLRKELEHLVSNNISAFKGMLRRVTRPIPTVEIVRASAEATIAKKTVREINPLLYQRAERKSAREAVDALIRGDIEGSFEAKQRELLNHELYRAAITAREEIDKSVDFMKKFTKTSTRERIGKAGESYLDQIDAITDRFDFSKNISLKSVDRRKSLLKWVQEQQGLGYDIDVPERLLNEAYRQHYKDITFDELVGLRDTVKSIEHLAGLKNKLLANEDSRNFQNAVDEITAAISAHHELKDEKWDIAPSMTDIIKERTQSVIASHTRMEFLFEFLDGNKAQGAVWEHMFKPFVDAENYENQMMGETTKRLNEIFSVYTKAERSRWFFDKTYIPEAETAKIKGSFTKANILTIALNWGNAYNRDALMRGYGWNEAQVEKVLEKLDKRDWETVQALWDHINTYWPKVEAMEKKLNGIAPEKVESTPVKTKFGEFKGGYYPVVFDPRFSIRQEKLDNAQSVQEMFGGSFAKAMTKHGHTVERTGTGGKPIVLNMSGLTNHLTSVIHDISHRPAIIDVSRLVHTKEVREAITQSAGKQMYKQLNPWLTSIAGDRQIEPSGIMEGILSRARTGATVASLGLKFTSAIVQTLGYAITVKELGVKYAMKGLTDAFGNPLNFKKNWEFITERSEMMAKRVGNADRDVRDASKKLNISGARPGILSVTDTYTKDVTDSFFMLTNYMDLATSVPTWLGAYRQAMDGGLENVEKGDEKRAVAYADQVVRQSQSAGSAKDNAGIQRGSELKKIFTMFYSSLSIQFNQFFKTYNQYRFDKNVPRLIGSLAMLWFVPAVMEDILKGRGPDSDDEPEEWLKWMARNEVSYPFQTIVGVRDFVSSYNRYADTGVFEYSGSPAIGAVESVLKGLAVAGKPLMGEEVSRSDVKGLVKSAGIAFALPTNQTWMTLEYFHDWMTGEENPDNPIEGAWRALVIGKEKKK